MKNQKSLNVFDDDDDEVSSHLNKMKIASSGLDANHNEQLMEQDPGQVFDNSIKFIDQQNSLTTSQVQALALFEQNS